MTPYLLFGMNGARYGVEAQSVLEIAWLPELAPAEEAPPYIAGIVNRRDKIEPVMNPGLRLGHPQRRYQMSDSIVMLQADGVTMGVIVSEVSDVVVIPESAIEPPPRYDEESLDQVHFLAGNAKVGDEINPETPNRMHIPASDGSMLTRHELEEYVSDCVILLDQRIAPSIELQGVAGDRRSGLWAASATG